MRADGRRFDRDRCLIPVSAFYEFTAPWRAAPKRALKTKWAFALAGPDWFCIAGLWRTDPIVGEAWAMLTCPPGPDVAPYHARQVVELGPEGQARWLDPMVSANDLCRPSPVARRPLAR